MWRLDFRGMIDVNGMSLHVRMDKCSASGLMTFHPVVLVSGQRTLIKLLYQNGVISFGLSLIQEAPSSGNLLCTRLRQAVPTVDDDVGTGGVAGCVGGKV